ncbi:glutamyl-tRNA reductase [Microlunatus speluncae]|uniref:glutamyl-tRNA reductase n=1 Tax=Microlunatus speluncae TaxID=2594267 RepID=UPI00126641EF|nr:glutamyl-tRNA reductase [Microlunatus speluncae]
MSILVVGVSHKTTSIERLSRIALDGPAAAKLTDALVAGVHVDEAVVLSTCNRTEVYASVSRFHGGLDEVTAELSAVAGIGVEELRDECAVYFDEGAVAHAFAVAAGLESMVVGESQILGQLRLALSAAQRQGAAGSTLNALFQQALRVGKRVQTETAIGAAGRSLVTAAYEALADDHGSLDGARMVVVGAGSMASLAARTAAALGAELTIVNRTKAKADRLAEAVAGTSVPLAQLDRALAGADILLTCTGGRDLKIGADQLTGTPIRTVIDLAVPSDVDPTVAATGIAVIDIARLGDRLKDERQDGADAAAELVRNEVADFLGSRRAAQVAPTVVALRTMATEVMAAELDRLDARLPELGDKERQEIHRSVRRVVDKLLHAPTVRVQALASGGESVDYAAVLRELFALDPQTVAAVMKPEVRR